MVLYKLYDKFSNFIMLKPLAEARKLNMTALVQKVGEIGPFCLFVLLKSVFKYNFRQIFVKLVMHDEKSLEK